MMRPALLDDGPWAAVLAAARPDGCALHLEHQPRTLALHRHHIWPLGMDGPDADWNELLVCPTGHVNVHLLLKDLHRGKPSVHGGYREKAIAKLGYALWTEAGKPGGKVTMSGHELIAVNVLDPTGCME